MKSKSFLAFLIMLFMSFNMMASENQPSEDEVTKLYVATFDRAPDSAGLLWWVNESNLKLSGIAQSFFDQVETKALYPDGISMTVFVESIYGNLFNRASDNAGLNYWVGELNKGSITKHSFIQTVINGAKGEDALLLSNKTEASKILLESEFHFLQAEDILANITAETSTLNFFKGNYEVLNYLQSSIENNTSDTNITIPDSIYKNIISQHLNASDLENIGEGNFMDFHIAKITMAGDLSFYTDFLTGVKTIENASSYIIIDGEIVDNADANIAKFIQLHGDDAIEIFAQNVALGKQATLQEIAQQLLNQDKGLLGTQIGDNFVETNDFQSENPENTIKNILNFVESDKTFEEGSEEEILYNTAKEEQINDLIAQVNSGTSYEEIYKNLLKIPENAETVEIKGKILFQQLQNDYESMDHWSAVNTTFAINNLTSQELQNYNATGELPESFFHQISKNIPINSVDVGDSLGDDKLTGDEFLAKLSEQMEGTVPTSFLENLDGDNITFNPDGSELGVTQINKNGVSIGSPVSYQIGLDVENDYLKFTDKSSHNRMPIKFGEIATDETGNEYIDNLDINFGTIEGTTETVQIQILGVVPSYSTYVAPSPSTPAPVIPEPEPVIDEGGGQ